MKKTGVDTLLVSEMHVMTIGIVEFLRILGLFELSVLDQKDGMYWLIGPVENLECFSSYWAQKTLVM